MSTVMNFEYLINKECIDLSFNGLHDGNIETLVEVLEKTQVLAELNLWSNRIALDDDKFTDALAQNSTLQILSLGSNQIASEGGIRLAAAIKANTSIKEIHLGDNYIGDAGAESFADALTSNTSLRMLSIYGNNIGDIGAQSLAASFKANQSLRVVWLHENKIGDVGGMAMVEALRCNTTIEKVFVITNKMAKSVDEEIQNVLKDASCRGASSDNAEESNVVKLKEKEGTSLHEELTRKEEELQVKDEELAALKKALEARDEEILALKTALENSTPVVDSADLTTTTSVPIKNKLETTFEEEVEQVDDARDEMDIVSDAPMTLQIAPSLELERCGNASSPYARY